MKILLLSTLLLSGCHFNTCSQDIDVYRHVVRFFDTYDEDSQSLCNANYGDPEEGNYGIAYISFARCDIVIREDLEPFTEKYVIYHEIGHCLGLEHVDNPNSIMYDTALDEDFYRDNSDLLEDELREQIEHNKY